MKISKLNAVLLLLSILLLLPTGCVSKLKGEEHLEVTAAPIAGSVGQAQSSTENNTKTIELVTDSWEPYEYEINGEARGISSDLAREAFTRMGYNVSIKVYPWARAVEMVKNGEADGVFSAYKNAERETFADFPAEPLLNDIVSLFVRNDSNIVFDGDIMKLKNHSFGIDNGFTYGEEFDKAVENKIIKAEVSDSTNANIEKLLSKRIDIYYSPKFVTITALKRMGKLSEVKELTPEARRDNLYLMFSKKRNLKDTIEHFDRTMLEMKSDGTYDRIVNSYLN